MTITRTALKGPARAGDRLFDRFEREVSLAGLPPGPVDERPVTEDDLVGLPPAARRYFGFMGVIGRPRDWSFRARFVGRFRLNPKLGWMPAEAWQYDSAITVGRVFVMRIRFARVVPMIGVDIYHDGHGRMLGKLGGLVTVADGQGEEFDIGELTTYLNDAVLLAPSFLLRPTVAWAQLDNDSFDVTLSDNGRSVTAGVFLDHHCCRGRRPSILAIIAPPISGNREPRPGRRQVINRESRRRQKTKSPAPQLLEGASSLQTIAGHGELPTGSSAGSDHPSRPFDGETDGCSVSPRMAPEPSPANFATRQARKRALENLVSRPANRRWPNAGDLHGSRMLGVRRRGEPRPGPLEPRLVRVGLLCCMARTTTVVSEPSRPRWPSHDRQGASRGRRRWLRGLAAGARLRSRRRAPPRAGRS